MSFDEDEIRREFKETFEQAGHLNTVIVLKDTHTIEKEPRRFTRWVEMGREVFTETMT